MEGVGRLIVSVIMLTYNREKFVSRAIKCVLGQTFKDFEFIIINNGSDDKSGEIAEQYAATDSRIHVIHRERGNIGSGRNAGLDAAKGENIAFVDDDDLCERDYLEFLYRLASENNAEISICGAADKVFNEKRVLCPEDALIELLWREKYNVAFPAKLFKASLFDGVRFSETSKYDDIELMPRILGSANKIAYHGLPKYTFVRHESNNSAWTTNHNLLDAETLAEYLAVYRSRTIWLIDKFPLRTMTWRYFEWSFMLSMVEKISRLGLLDCEKQGEMMASELAAHAKDFMECGLILDYESKWMEQYVLHEFS